MRLVRAEVDSVACGVLSVVDLGRESGQIGVGGVSNLDPAAALLAVAEALEAGQSVPRGYALWLAAAMRAFLATEGSSLEALLGLKPRRGGAFETVWQLQRRIRRDSMLAELAFVLEDSVWACSRRIAALLAATRAGGPIEAPDSARMLITRLLAEYGDITPASSRQLARILSGDCISRRRQ